MFQCRNSNEGTEIHRVPNILSLKAGSSVKLEHLCVPDPRVSCNVSDSSVGSLVSPHSQICYFLF